MFRLFSIVLGVVLAGSTVLSAQSLAVDKSAWLRVSEQLITVPEETRQFRPDRYLTYWVNIDLLRNQLANAPTEQDVLSGDAAALLVEFPNPDGSFTRYKVWDFGIFHPDLQAKYPDIRSYCGVSLDDPYGHVFFDISPKGFHSMTLRSPGGSVWIDPYSTTDNNHYVVYYRRDYTRDNDEPFVCHFEDENPDAEWVPHFNGNAPEYLPQNNCGVRREYRLAMAATGEYTTYHGGTVALGLAAINTSMTRVNGVFLTEMSILMRIIANNNLIVYTNATTDPYTNSSGSTMLGENQTNLDAVIMTPNYDIGHVFSTGGGGVASLRSPCNNSTKARGVTGRGNPIGDPFDIDYVAHEIGHQYNDSHTFASTMSGFCSGNTSSTSAMEPGSGTTIMSYAGICSPQNVQPNSDDYFHARSLFQTDEFVRGLTSAGAHNCDAEIAVANNPPSVATFTNVTFPISTPFVLTGSATDPNGHALTYCWEQYDNAGVDNPLSTNTTGPLFRSIEPVSVGYRYFPKFATTFAGTTDTWELLPSVARTMTFRFTARDNQGGPVAAPTSGGCTDEENIVVTIVNFGPLALTAPNGSVPLNGNNPYTVTWDVNGTNANGINATNVDILYSTNPSDPTSYVMLLANTPNDGSQSVTMPNITSSTFRIMVRSSSTNGIFFFDISNANNTITISAPVELTGFDVEMRSQQAQLRWTTASEVNNKGFTIERSTDNTRHFEAIGWVDAVSTLNTVNRYQYDDAKIKPGYTYYYRLAQTDVDGTITYSDIRSIKWEATTRQLQIAPNPATDYVLLTAEGVEYDEVFDIVVTNMHGQVVAQRSMTLNNALSVRDWPAGVYQIRAVAARQIWTGKIVH
jgi:Metallo-peptidase family M12B Reprolysin-like/Secretion system C-terminal sorting domain